MQRHGCRFRVVWIASFLKTLGRATFFSWALLVGLCFCVAQAEAGGGPQNLLLIVNPKSADSLAIANRYIELRKIPSRNVVCLPWDPTVLRTDVETFRNKILRPIDQIIRRGRMAPQIDMIVYSTGFPTAIDASADVEKFLATKSPEEQKNGWPKTSTKVGSLTGLTYLRKLVLAADPHYLGLSTNWYYRLSVQGKQLEPTRGFAPQLRFRPDGNTIDRAKVDPIAQEYILSVMLGVAKNAKMRGNSRDEILSYLTRSVAADETAPDGTIFFVDNHEVRSRTRQPRYKPAIDALTKLGVKALQVDHRPPQVPDSIMGLSMGKARFDWKPMADTIRAGAICENLTSFGGDMRISASQTPFTEFLRYGAAGSSGTVVEPFALPAKFPDPMIQAHYASGCSLAEAFYQSVYGPYQLLIVGEPLCQPWAKKPKVAVERVPKEGKIRGELTLRPKIVFPTYEPKKTEKVPDTLAPGRKCGWYVNGLKFRETAPNEGVSIDTALLPDGYHEIRLVAIGSAPIYTQGYTVVPIELDNHGHSITAWLSPPEKVAIGAMLVVTAKSPGAKRIDVFHHRRRLATITGESGQVEIDPKWLGSGTVSLRVVGFFGAAPQDCVIARPLNVWVDSGSN
jgi:hypothetical protein